MYIIEINRNKLLELQNKIRFSGSDFGARILDLLKEHQGLGVQRMNKCTRVVS